MILTSTPTKHILIEKENKTAEKSRLRPQRNKDKSKYKVISKNTKEAITGVDKARRKVLQESNETC